MQKQKLNYFNVIVKENLARHFAHLHRNFDKNQGRKRIFEDWNVEALFRNLHGDSVLEG